MTPREIALSICEPWFNGDPCEGCKCHKVCTKLVERIEAAIRAERVPETNFGNMAQAIDSTGADHIPDATKMVEPVAYITGYFDGKCVIKPVEHVVFPAGMALYRSPPTSQESRQVKPVAWMVYTLDGKSAFVTDNPADFTPEHRALPLYTAPPKREPLTDAHLTALCRVHWDRQANILDHIAYARAVERAHGIGGEK